MIDKYIYIILVVSGFLPYMCAARKGMMEASLEQTADHGGQDWRGGATLTGLGGCHTACQGRGQGHRGRHQDLLVARDVRTAPRQKGVEGEGRGRGSTGVRWTEYQVAR